MSETPDMRMGKAVYTCPICQWHLERNPLVPVGEPPPLGLIESHWLTEHSDAWGRQK